MVTDRRAPPGIICALITPFDDDERADRGALEEIVEFQVDRGTHGLFVLGTTGEGVLLPASERMEVAAWTMEAAGSRIPVIVHCGAADTKTVVELARHAEAISASAAAVVAPYYFHYGEEELVRHFATVAEAAPDLGHYVYENPSVVGYAMGVRVVTRLIDEVEQIRGVKDTGDSIGKIVEYLAHPGEPPDVYVGNNLLILAGLAVGASGAVSALANAVPELVTGIRSAWSDGRMDEARQLQLDLAHVHGALAGIPYVAGVKHLVKRRGLPAGGTRSPQASVTPEQAAMIDRRLAAYPDLPRWLEPVVHPAPATRTP